MFIKMIIKIPFCHARGQNILKMEFFNDIRINVYLYLKNLFR